MRQWLTLSISIVSISAILTLSIVSSFAFQREISAYQVTIKGLESEVQSLSEKAVVTDPKGGIEIDLENLKLPIHADDFIDYSSPYGPRRSPFTGTVVHHPGLDLFGTWHARVIALGSGVVIEHWIPPGQVAGFSGHRIFGGCIVLQMDDGAIITLGHLSETYVKEGLRVEAGQVLGRQGSTGVSTGEHLHLGVTVDGEEKNPLQYLIALDSANNSDLDSGRTSDATPYPYLGPDQEAEQIQGF